jgi:glycosyltransferase involved in cell wall biosynthesis
MPRVVIANLATDVPMGAQVYQEQIAARTPSALGDGWRSDRMVIRSLRSPLDGTRRLPMSRLTNAGPRERRLAGRLLFPRAGVAHRMNLEIPPSPQADVITLHDVVSWKFTDESAPVRAAAEEARRAAAVICVSAFTAAEAVELLGIGDPVVVPNGVDPRYLDAEPAAAETLASWQIDGPYVMTGGGASARKNLEALAAAWPLVQRACPELTLVLSGPPHPRRTGLFRGLTNVRLLGRVDSALVPGLMASASAVVVPSLYEGFGLPALEAMAARTPLVAAATSSLPEVVGDGGTLVEPTPASIAEGVIHAVSGHSDVAAAVRRGRARAAEFTWERSAAAHARVWREVAART